MPPPIPFRGLAERGIIKDAPPYDVDMRAFTGGSNVRFSGRKARRAPVFRRFQDTLPFAPQGVFGYRPAAGFDQVIMASDTGLIAKVDSGVITDVTPSGRTPSSSTAAWTGTFLGDVFYLNRPSHIPAGFIPGASAFADLTAWDSTWRARSLRAYRDFLVVVDVTKGADRYPTMVKWSDATLVGAMPASWDETDLSTLANEVVLAQLDSPLVDAVALRSALVLYSGTQVWLAEFTGDTSDAGQNLFTFRPLFASGGMIAPNCAVEVRGRHFVFGTSDLYVHDGTAPVSIAEGAVREWVFRYLDARNAERCFVQHMEKYNEVIFGFVSSDPEAVFTNPTRCNRAVVYNYDNGTWSIRDLPNVCGLALANADPTLIWSGAGTRTWATTGGSWADLRDGFEENLIFGATAITGGPTDDLLLAYDPMDDGTLSYPLEASATAPAFLERVGLDFDEAGAPLRSYKVMSTLVPQVNTRRDIPVVVEIGASMTPAGSITWGQPISFDPVDDYKVDSKVGGRYLAVRFTIAEPSDFDVSGFDVEIVTGGSR